MGYNGRDVMGGGFEKIEYCDGELFFFLVGKRKFIIGADRICILLEYSLDFGFLTRVYYLG